MRATGCWIEGFDAGIDFSVIAGKTHTIKNCMIVRAKSNDGWAFAVRSMPGGDTKKNARKLLIELHGQGKGPAETGGLFARGAPGHRASRLRDSGRNAPRVGATGQRRLSSQSLKWSGTSNRYDVQGKAWVVLKPDGSAPMPGGPGDFSAWTKLFTDQSSSASAISFQADGSAPPESLVPDDFALEGEGDSNVGADPAKVGPQGATLR